MVVTVSKHEADRLRCQVHNVDADVTKPVDLDKFLDLVLDLKRFWHADVIN